MDVGILRLCYHEKREVEREFAEKEEGAAAVAGVASETATHPPHEQELDEEGHRKEADDLWTAREDA